MGSRSINRGELVDYLDELLDVASIENRSDNGLKGEGIDIVERVAFAVDANLAQGFGLKTAFLDLPTGA